jgi:putative aminopeptidase FrvX
VRGAIPAATIAVPGRYAHTPTMMINLDDYANVIKLAKVTLLNLTEDIVKRN